MRTSVTPGEYHTVGYGGAMRVHVVPGGPVLIEGVSIGRLRRTEAGSAIDPLEAADACAVCRCGRSGSMPLCDRAEPYACFEEEPADGPPPAPFRWDVPDPDGPPAIALKPDGPIRFAGGVPITYGDRQLPPRDRLSLCRCGASRCQPLCDSSHKVVGYRD
jgi:CDGSH-type Zn-finger protein